LPEGATRDAVIENLSDEVTAPSHPELFDEFTRSFGADETVISPAMSDLVQSYFRLFGRSPASSLAGLWAYESQTAAIAESKAEGLVKHYGADSETIAFWRVHRSIEVDHAR
jgi:pyrroloquinoline quinone (PQQ) biosynthesis protein C